LQPIRVRRWERKKKILGGNKRGQDNKKNLASGGFAKGRKEAGGWSGPQPVVTTKA